LRRGAGRAPAQQLPARVIDVVVVAVATELVLGVGGGIARGARAAEVGAELGVEGDCAWVVGYGLLPVAVAVIFRSLSSSRGVDAKADLNRRRAVQWCVLG